MKLADRYDLDRLTELNAGGPRFVRDHLATAGLEELASVDFWDEDVQHFYAATDLGLYVGTYTPRRDIRDEPKVEGAVTPWRDVTGVHLSLTGFIRDGLAIYLRIGEPAFERVSDRDRDLKGLADFGRVCLQRHGRP